MPKDRANVFSGRLALEGVRIVAVEQYGALPFGTMHLADMGAEVIKVEDHSRGGDVSRTVGPFAEDGDSLFFQSLNRNKRSMSLNLSLAEDRKVFNDLVRCSDAVVNNLRGDVPRRLGITYEALGTINSAIVTLSLSGFGSTGPRVSEPGYDYLAQAMAGFMSVTGEPGDPPTRFGLSIVDFMSGITAALGVVSAIFSARDTGRGMDVDVSLLEVAVSNLNYLAAWYLNEGYTPPQIPDGGHPSLVPSQRFVTRDGYIYIMCNKEKFWGNLCNAVMRPEWVTDSRFCNFDARYRNRGELVGELNAVLSTRNTEEWTTAFGSSVPHAAVNTVAEALREPQVLARDMIVEVPHEKWGHIKEISSPLKFSNSRMPLRTAPDLGGDTRYVLNEILGYKPDRIESYLESIAR